ncbi:hypothetical protein J6590_048800 [Homalodisca vitripennis]|nr:hypothetical protein J6590_048800 [Homalodisca vitripennis]
MNNKVLNDAVNGGGGAIPPPIPYHNRLTVPYKHLISFRLNEKMSISIAVAVGFTVNFPTGLVLHRTEPTVLIRPGARLTGWCGGRNNQGVGVQLGRFDTCENEFERNIENQSL